MTEPTAGAPTETNLPPLTASATLTGGLHGSISATASLGPAPPTLGDHLLEMRREMLELWGKIRRAYWLADPETWDRANEVVEAVKPLLRRGPKVAEGAGG